MMLKDYLGYKADDLLKDDFFIHYVRHPTSESDSFWENQGVERKEVEWAKFFIESSQVESEDFPDEVINAIWENIQIENENRRLAKSRKTKRMIMILSIAAGFLLIVSIAPHRLFKETPAEKRIDMASLAIPQTTGQDIQLILADDRQMSIEGENAEIEYDKQGAVTINANDQLLADNDNKEPEKIKQQAFNQLIVPLGKRSKLTLSDGSEVWINAGTRVVYPTAFEGDSRTIFIDGEVFLNVVPDKKHPFIVQTNYLDVNVLGTSFDLSAYKSDECFSVVLVSGSVSTKKTGQKEELFKLAPGERLTYSEQSVLITKVNTNNYTSWKDGFFYFQSENMATILKRLSRYYGKEITCDAKTAAHRCSGKLDLLDELQDILNGFTLAIPVQIKEQNNAFYVRWNE
jgi:hypothetical protein